MYLTHSEQYQYIFLQNHESAGREYWLSVSLMLLLPENCYFSVSSENNVCHFFKVML